MTLKKLFMPLCIILMMCLVGCGRHDEIITDPNTTASSDWLIMKATSYPGEVGSQEEYDNGVNTYEIYFSGQIIDKDGDKIVLSEKDTDELVRLYNKFCDKDVSITEGVIFDYPGYEIVVYDRKGKELEYSSDANKQCKEVGDVFHLIFSNVN